MNHHSLCQTRQRIPRACNCDTLVVPWVLVYVPIDPEDDCFHDLVYLPEEK
jgi:hypothetical protein